MKPKNTEDPQNRIFQMHLENIINMKHELVLLSGKINYRTFEKKFCDFFTILKRFTATKNTEAKKYKEFYYAKF